MDVAFTFDFDAEEVWIAQDPGNADRPGVLSHGTYGARVGVPLILELLERQGVKSTFFVPGRVGERHPERVRDILAAGHEIGLHGYTHRSPQAMSEAEERDELRRARAVLEGLGAKLAGYRSPSWEFSPRTVPLLVAEGLRYSSNFMDDVRPYLHSGTSLVELPVHWMLDDAPHFWFSSASWDRKIATNGEVRAIWEAEFLALRKLGGVCVFTMHPQLIGRPSRLTFLECFREFVAGHDGVRIQRCVEIADDVASVRPAA
jgi:peptidoglycan/xylan/chitin deacetylase (PgdA/CDA1 family)